MGAYDRDRRPLPHTRPFVMIRRLRTVVLRIIGLFFPTRAENDFDAELDSHLRMHVDENIRSGMNAEEARRDALMRLGGMTQTKEAYRAQRGLPAVDAACRDF